MGENRVPVLDVIELAENRLCVPADAVVLEPLQIANPNHHRRKLVRVDVGFQAVELRGCDLEREKRGKATLLDSVGAPLGTVQALLGHSSSALTRETYIGSVPLDARKAVEGVEKLLGTRDSLIGPKWTQVPEFPELRSTLINCYCGI